jgi:hypothetical protein
MRCRREANQGPGQSFASGSRNRDTLERASRTIKEVTWDWKGKKISKDAGCWVLAIGWTDGDRRHMRNRSTDGRRCIN